MEIHLRGRPNEKQALFFAASSRYVAYGGARGGGKSWALRRKLVALCLLHDGIRCLLVRRSFGELKGNHLYPLLSELGELAEYRDSEKLIRFPNGSVIAFGYCDAERDALRYQGQEYDVIAIDEATPLSEEQFSIFKACLRGTKPYPRRMYLTCNPGGVGHSWVKRLFIDRRYREGERAEDYTFIPAKIYDNDVLLSADPDYVSALESLPEKLRKAWLLGEWDVFEGQFFPEFSISEHTVDSAPSSLTLFAAADYGLDRFVILLLGVDRTGRVWCLDEYAESDLTLGEAGAAAEKFLHGWNVRYLTVSPDLYNRRQDTGRSGIELFSYKKRLPPLTPADNRRVQGWRVVREYLAKREDGKPGLLICKRCQELIRCMPLLLCDPIRVEDASDSPHEVTHAPEALRYGLISRSVYLS